MRARHPLPALWLISDARNDAMLEAALKRLPRGSGFVFRHYHLPTGERFARLARLARVARARGHVVIVAGPAELARAWRVDGFYIAPSSSRRTPGSPRGEEPWDGTRLRLPPGRRGKLLRLVTVHSLREIGAANRMGADAALLSPVFATRSHPGAKVLGPLRFRLLASHAAMPVIALGGMDERNAGRLAWPRWAAIDGLSSESTPSAPSGGAEMTHMVPDERPRSA